MAKTTICAFCGKEITTGFFSGEARDIAIADNVEVPCCEECYETEKKIAKAFKAHFTTKLENYKWENRSKVSLAEAAKMYVKYKADMQEFLEKNKGKEPQTAGSFYVCDDEGNFGWTERRQGFVNSDVSTKDKIKTLKTMGYDVFGFTKEDISCIEYRLCDSQQLGLFQKAYSLVICLNHEKEVSIKPCFSKTVIVTKKMLFGYRKKAVREAEQMLETFKKRIGSDLEIKEVKKFR